MGRNAEAIADGVAIALAAARLAVKNQILVETIAHDETFDVSRLAPMARDAVIVLADEAEQAAEGVRRARKSAWGKHSQPGGTHDYRDRDVRNLRRRARQYSGVAKELRERADDSERVGALLDDAREAAWGDVAANLDRRLDVEGMRPDDDPDYVVMRGARMQALRLVDLQRLSAETKYRRNGDEAE